MDSTPVRKFKLAALPVMLLVMALILAGCQPAEPGLPASPTDSPTLPPIEEIPLRRRPKNLSCLTPAARHPSRWTSWAD